MQNEALAVIRVEAATSSNGAGHRPLLDLTVYGRQERWQASPRGWPRWAEGEHNDRADGRPIVQWFV